MRLSAVAYWRLLCVFFFISKPETETRPVCAGDEQGLTLDYTPYPSSPYDSMAFIFLHLLCWRLPPLLLSISSPIPSMLLPQTLTSNLRDTPWPSCWPWPWRSVSGPPLRCRSLGRSAPGAHGPRGRAAGGGAAGSTGTAEACGRRRGPRYAAIVSSPSNGTPLLGRPTCCWAACAPS